MFFPGFFKYFSFLWCLEIKRPRRLDGTRYLTYDIRLIPHVHFAKGWYNGISFRTRHVNGTLMFIEAEGGENILIQVSVENGSIVFFI